MTEEVTTEAAASSPAPEPKGSLAGQAAEDAVQDRLAAATYDAAMHAALPGVDTGGSRVHRPFVNGAR